MIGGHPTTRGRSERAAEDRPPQRPWSLFAVLQQEFEELHGAPGAGATPDPDAPAGEAPEDLEELYRRIHVLPVPRAALCLSGGGIRSASFALGVLQALARHGLLQQFHYLSTVSGGGYIGSWLSAWRHHERDDDAVFARLTERGSYSVAQNDGFAEPAELRELRANSNFLTPRLGFLSGDTWTGIVLYVRNLLLNWFIFGPLFLSVLLVPHSSFDVLIWVNDAFGTVNWTALTMAAVLWWTGLAMSVGGRPARNRPSRSGLPQRPVVPSRQRFMYCILLPIYLGAGVLATFTAWLPTTPDALRWGILVNGSGGVKVFYSILYAMAFGAVVYAAAWLMGYFAGGGRLSELRRITGRRRDPVPPFAEMICYALSGAAAGGVVALGIAHYQHLSGLAEDPQASGFVAFLFQGYSRIYMVAAAGVAWTMTAILAADLFFTGLTSYHRYGNADREWSARAAGYLAGAAIGWLVFAAIVLYGPPAAGIILAMVGGAAGLATLVLGSSAKTAATVARQAAERFSITTILSIATIIFVLVLAILLSKFARLGLDYGAATLGVQNNSAAKAGISMGASVALAGVAVLASYWINVNRFSLHAVYRNRLVRAFLGAARASHRDRGRNRSNPDPFTGFDQADNLRLASLWLPGGNEGRQRLFHVVNMALNVVASTNLAWQERKAEPFVMTPLACGNPFVKFAPTRFYGDPRDGITLGTAMAISGAAVSPNQGYHSSPIVGLLLLLFNVRLGWWLGNPQRGSRTYRREGPFLSIRPVLDELAGRTTDAGRYIYLSDGGHFENLGLYEMVRRRCHFILVSDAGCDPAGALEDLGNAVRKIWIDLGIRIEFDRIDVTPRQTPPVDGVYCALGRIRYPEEEAKEGALIYVKPGFHGSEPADVRAFAALHKDFPHESTADQWFSESQMESYRALGSHIIDKICGGGGEDTPGRPEQDAQQLGIDTFVCSVCRYLKSTRPRPRVAEPTGDSEVAARPDPASVKGC
jgi:patatin-like phospholipase